MARLLAPALALTFAITTFAAPALAGDLPSTPAIQEDDSELLARRRRRKKKPKPAPEAAAPAPTGDAAPLPARRGPSRVDFDERVIKGQTNKANAIYLFQRRESRLRTLVKKRKHFHELIDETLE